MTFDPNGNCTRAQTVTFLRRANGSPAVSGNSAFLDVTSDAYYATAVAWAEKNGVTGGIGNGLFGSGNNCTDFLQDVQKRAKYHYWLFGHYHDNKAVDEKHILLWEQIVQIC